MLIDDKTRQRIVWVVFAWCMIAAMGWQDLVWAIIWGAALAGLLVAGVRSWNTRQQEAAKKERATLKRMRRQHQQTMQGDERGTYGSGYKTHQSYLDELYPPVDLDDEEPRPKPGQGGHT